MIFSSLLSIRSHPVRVRGLKQGFIEEVKRGQESHPVRVRGLKHDLATKKTKTNACRTPCGCVD